MKKILVLAIVLATTSLSSFATSKTLKSRKVATKCIRDCGRYASETAAAFENNIGCLDTATYNWFYGTLYSSCSKN